MARKLIIAALWLVGMVSAQTTPNLNFNIPPHNKQFWDVLNNANFSALDLLLSGNATVPAINVTSLSSSKTTTKSLNNIKFADQYGGFTDAAIQAAINDAETVGGEVYLSPGTWALCGSLPLTINSRVTVRGSGWNTILQVCGAASATTDVIAIAPTGNSTLSGFKLSDFQISAASGHPGRYGIRMNGTGGEIADGTIDHLLIQQLGAQAIEADGSGLAQGTPVLTTIENSVLYGGTLFQNAGDTVRVINNQITGPNIGVDASFQCGASTLIVGWNNITTLGGGIHIGTCAVGDHIIGNEIETFALFTGSNGALIDLDGTSGSRASSVEIAGNSCQVVNGITADCIRNNYADNTNIYANRFGRGAGVSHDIHHTVNSQNATVGTNVFGATPFFDNNGSTAAIIYDEGTLNGFAPLYSGTLVLNTNKSVGGINDVGNVQSIIKTNSDGTTSFYGYHGALAIGDGNGATYMYDGTSGNHPAVAGGTAASGIVGTATHATVNALDVQQHINQTASGKFGGTCVFAAATTCAVTYGTAFTSTPIVLLQPVNPGAVTFTLTSTSNTGFTITGSGSNSLTVNWTAIGNPN